MQSGFLILSPAKSLSDKFKTGSAAKKHHPFLHQAQSQQGLLPSWEHLKSSKRRHWELAPNLMYIISDWNGGSKLFTYWCIEEGFLFALELIWRKRVGEEDAMGGIWSRRALLGWGMARTMASLQCRQVLSRIKVCHLLWMLLWGCL